MKKTLILAAKEAGSILKDMFKTSQKIRFKTPGKIGSIVTEADIASNKKILSIIKANFPLHNVISEESKPQNKGSSYTWIIDPMDGTQNFVLGMPEFGVSIALAKGKEILMGVVYLPVLDEFYFAEKNKGSFLNGKKINISNVKKLDKSTVSINFTSKPNKYTFNPKIMFDAMRFFKTSSIVFSLVLVASARFDGYIGIGMSPWDVAASYIIVKEAKGKFTNFDGNNFDYNDGNIIASNNYIHKELLTYLIKK
ncbi:MAG TPA: inositol monophosphatase [Candidatus Nanoarchaeia archaeon]|nr:inositol monophosphatase [Candidatus Nanoarchaeia archaeon]